MNKERIYIIEWRSFGQTEITREIITATSLSQLFDYYSDLCDVVYFAFEDVTDTCVEDIERRMTYRGKYSV